jgi:hypothetical protein
LILNHFLSFFSSLSKKNEILHIAAIIPAVAAKAAAPAATPSPTGAAIAATGTKTGDASNHHHLLILSF